MRRCEIDMTQKTLEEKVDEIHEFCIRLEPIMKTVEALEKWAFIGNGAPSAKTQLYILWAAFLVLGGLALR